MLFLRPFKEPHRSLFNPYLSRFRLSLRCKKGFKISSTLVNFWGQHIVPVPPPSGPMCKSRFIKVFVPDVVIKAVPIVVMLDNIML
jgi:hypothetical protein